MPMIRIRDKATGRTGSVEASQFDAGKWERLNPTEDPKFQQKVGGGDMEDTANNIGKTIRSLPGGDVFSDMYGLPAEVGRRAYKTLGVPVGENPMLPPERRKQMMENPLGTAGGDVLDAAEIAMTIPTLGLKNYLTGKGVANLAEKRAAKSTATMGSSQIRKSVLDEIESTFGNTDLAIKKAAERWLKNNKYLSTESLGEMPMTAMDLLKNRREISRTLSGRGVSKFFHKATPEELAWEKISQVLSKGVHELAPGTKLPDKVYSLYQRFGGDIPQWLMRLGIGIPLAKTIGGRLGSAISRVVSP